MEPDRLDLIYRNAMLVLGILTSLLFILSLISLIEFPGMFPYLAIGMVATALAFLVLRSIFKYRDTFRVKSRK